MTPAQALLSGPRGRRLCMELAQRLDPRIRHSLFHLAREHDLARGATSVLYSRLTVAAEDEADAGGAGDDEPEEVTLDLLARQLHGLPPEQPSDQQVHRALAESVDGARYWQEPDGEDEVAGHPVIRDAMGRLAGRVVDSQPARRWSLPCAPVQWQLRWIEADGTSPRAAHSDPDRWSRETHEAEERAAVVRPRDPEASWGGQWWSVPLGLLQTADRVPEALDLVEDGFGWERVRVTPVRGDLRVLEITAPQDWVRLCREHPLDVTASRRHDWYRVTGRDTGWVIPDWQQVAERWDAVHLTTWAYLTGATRLLEITEDSATVIARWDPGTTYWLTGATPEEAGVPQEWRRARDGDDWRQVEG